MSEEQTAAGPSAASSGARSAASNSPSAESDAGGAAGSSEAAPSPAPPRPPVRRSTHDRYIAGVCGGVGRGTDVDPVIYRVVLAVLTIFGGIGVLLYALGWLLLPAEDEEQSEAQKLLSGRGRSSSILPLIGVAVSAILVIAFISAGSDVAIVVIVAFVVLAVILSKQRQTGQAGQAGKPSAQPSPGSGVPSAPMGAPPATGAVTSPRSTVPYEPRRMPSSFAGPYPTGTYPPPTAPPGFASPWPGADPYVPAPTEAGRPAPGGRKRKGSWLGFVTLAVAAVVGGILVATGVATNEDSGLPVTIAAVLVVIGLGLLVGTWAGRSRGLIVWGILATLALVTVATFDVPLRGGAGERRWSPTTVSAAEAAPYRLTTGEGTLDLSELEPATGTTADVEASVTIGRLVVDVPADTTVEVNGHVGLGHLALRTDPDTAVDREGFNLTANYTDAADTDSPTATSAGRIVLDVEVGVGELEVRRAPASR
jgi:phage shock protein PspC (stress-responsive transcriptional regulator)